MKWTNEATGRTIEIYNEDCMPALAKMQENEFELAIVDPPYDYSIGNNGNFFVAKKMYNKKEQGSRKKGFVIGQSYNNSIGILPNELYFDKLINISNNQIVWGGNYYTKYLHPTTCWIVWNKLNGKSYFGDFEMAWTSFGSANRMFNHTSYSKNRIHPTQKPACLYEWLLKNYAKENDRILDTHLGSGSIAIACWEMGFDLVGYELDTDYFKATCKRLNDHFNQQTLF